MIWQGGGGGGVQFLGTTHNMLLSRGAMCWLSICLLSLQIHSLLYSAPWEADSNSLLQWVHCPLAWGQPIVGTGREWDRGRGAGGRRVTGRGSSQPRGPRVS